MKKRKSYDTKIKYLARQELLPERYKRQIHRSLICKWKQEPVEKYVGYELNVNVDELYEIMKAISENERLQKALKAYYRINKTLRDIIGRGSKYVSKIRDHKNEIISAIKRTAKTITRKRAIKLLGISPSTYRTWAMETYYKCTHSLKKICSNAYPQQLTFKEIKKMHRLLMNKKNIYYPIISVAYYGKRHNIVKAHPNTWYKYARLMKIERRSLRKVKRRYKKGIRAKAPNEKWHADVTVLRTADGVLSYIYIVLDNFSRYITSWRISEKLCAKTRLETFEETIANAEHLKRRKGGKKISRIKRSQFIVDGGSENNNRWVDQMLKQYSKSVRKIVALRDTVKSNAMGEAINKVLKYQYLYTQDIHSSQHLKTVLAKSIHDYQYRRPNGSLGGLTPAEAYHGKQIDLKKEIKEMKNAMADRIDWNQSHSCQGCPFGCTP